MANATPRPSVDMDALLDEALMESFPASDPPAVTRAPQPTKEETARAAEKEKEASAAKRAESEELDEALEESFPASDPPSQTQPRKS